jgi:hypothetical protein
MGQIEEKYNFMEECFHILILIYGLCNNVLTVKMNMVILYLKSLIIYEYMIRINMKRTFHCKNMMWLSG